MKLLYFTDTHIRGRAPKNRKDDFVLTLERKLYEIINIIKEDKIDFVLHGGDLFHRPDISVSIVSRFARILAQIPKPIYIISGNHDVYGHNPNTINRTMLGLLSDLKIVNLIDNKKVILEKDDIKVQLTGQPYIYDIDNHNKNSYYKVDEKSRDIDYAIHLVHGMLLDRPFIKGVPYTLIEDIKDTLADITLAGHYHSGFPDVQIDGKYFINPGSMVRISNSLAEIDRLPKVVILELTDKINISHVNLETALDGREILDRQEIESNLFRSEKLFEFQQNINEALNFEKIDINEVLIEVSNAEGIGEDVRNEALKRIADIQMKGK